jgi:predicted acylesterase/phospholipase RssA
MAETDGGTMPSVLYGPARRALVLAGGGITGGLYEVGALMALDTLFENTSVREFDLYVGTSAGAFVASLVANGVSPIRIHDTLVRDRQTLPRLTGSQFLSVPWRMHLATIPKLAAAIPGVAHHLWANWREALVLDTLASLLNHFPPGVFSPDGLEAYVRRVLTTGGRSNEFRRLRTRLLIPATQLDTAEIRVFGEFRGDTTPISQAVAASAAVPVLFTPVTIDGVDYVDGAVSKTAHTRLAIDRGARLVVLVNPLRPLVLDGAVAPPLREGGALTIAAQSFRIAMQRRLAEGLKRHAYEHPDTDVVLLEPHHADVQLFDMPLMTYNLRQEVIRRGFRTTVKRILADYDRHAAIFARHDITLAARDVVEKRARRWARATGDAGASDAA